MSQGIKVALFSAERPTALNAHLILHAFKCGTLENEYALKTRQALYMAVQCGRQEAVLKLLQLGADKSIKSNLGKSPVDLAASLKSAQVTQSSSVFSWKRHHAANLTVRPHRTQR